MNIYRILRFCYILYLLLGKYSLSRRTSGISDIYNNKGTTAKGSTP